MFHFFLSALSRSLAPLLESLLAEGFLNSCGRVPSGGAQGLCDLPVARNSRYLLTVDPSRTSMISADTGPMPRLLSLEKPMFRLISANTPSAWMLLFTRAAIPSTLRRLASDSALSASYSGETSNTLQSSSCLGARRLQ